MFVTKCPDDDIAWSGHITIFFLKNSRSAKWNSQKGPFEKIAKMEPCRPLVALGSSHSFNGWQGLTAPPTQQVAMALF
jgi:hypothetical protein